MDQKQSIEEKGGSIHLQIDDDLITTESPTIFEPQTSIQKRDSGSNANSLSPAPKPPVRAPEKQLTLFALRLAVLEKAATGLGTLGFVWATVVLLGGFAITLDKTDFWFITIILLIEGTRIFSRSHELEWQHQATWSIADVGITSFRAMKSSTYSIVSTLKSIFRPIQKQSHRDSRQNRGRAGSMAPKSLGPALNRGRRRNQKIPTRTWVTTDVPLLPYGKWVFLSRNISKLLYWLQLASAIACAILSLMKLIRHNYGNVEKEDTDKKNRQAALSIFYSLALAEALLFLLEKAYWEWKVMYRKMLDEVNKECELGPHGMVSIRRFFYDAYSRCVNGSIFDGLKMDMVSFSIDLLGSDSQDEQLIGMRVLKKFALNPRFSDDTLQKIGLTLSVMERLVEMLNWKDPKVEEIRESAGEILSKLAGKKQNSLRVAGIPGAMESISSLLQNHRGPRHPTTDEICFKKIVHDLHDHDNYCIWKFNQLGLLILKKLSRDHDNCGKIGNTRGLLPKIIDFTHAGEKLLKDESVNPSQIMTVKRSLQLLKMLASTAGTTGEQLRKEISEVVFTISNIRDILRYGEKHPVLQQLAIEILTNLAMEEDATERLGGTGGILRELFNIFLKEGRPESEKYVKIAAGEALAMLALESKSNCHRILKLNVIDKLVEALELPLLRINAARILTNLCTYAGSDSFLQLRRIAPAAPTVLKSINSEENKVQEVMIGLAAQVFKLMTPQESSTMFERSGIREEDLATTLVKILRKHEYPPTKTSRIRRFVIELAIQMMKDRESNVRVFKGLGLEKELERVVDTTSEIENFNIFSGTMGLSRYRTKIDSLVETAMRLMEDKQ